MLRNSFRWWEDCGLEELIRMKKIIGIFILCIMFLLLVTLVVTAKTAIEWNDEGFNLLFEGNYEEALEAFNKALEIDPVYTEAWNNKGMTLTGLGRYEEAIVCFNMSLAIDSRDVVTWNNKGSALRDLGRYEEAIECYDKALVIYLQFAPARNNKEDILTLHKPRICGSFGRSSGVYNAALVEAMNNKLEEDPLDSLAWRIKGRVLARSGRYEEAITCYDKALEIKPQFMSLLGEKGEAFLYLERYEEALECFDKVLEINSHNSMRLIMKGEALAGLGRYEEALECYDKALEIEENYPKDHDCTKLACRRALNNKGSALQELGRYEEALECYDKALEIDPQDFIARYSKNETFHKLGKTEKGKSTPSPEGDVPAFEAVFAIAGLLAVANVLRKRKK